MTAQRVIEKLEDDCFWFITARNKPEMALMWNTLLDMKIISLEEITKDSVGDVMHKAIRKISLTKNKDLCRYFPLSKYNDLTCWFFKEVNNY